MHNKVMNASTPEIQFDSILLRVAFVGGALGVLWTTVLVQAASLGIPFSQMDDLQGHLHYLSSHHWQSAIYSMKTLGFLMSVVMLALSCMNYWNPPRWFRYPLLIISPICFAALGDIDSLILLKMPWWLLATPLVAVYGAYLMLFHQVDGEFFSDGEGLMMEIGWWILFCMICWSVQRIREGRRHA